MKKYHIPSGSRGNNIAVIFNGFSVGLINYGVDVAVEDIVIVFSQIKATPHKDSAADALPIFSSECAKRAQLT